MRIKMRMKIKMKMRMKIKNRMRVGMKYKGIFGFGLAYNSTCGLGGC